MSNLFAQFIQYFLESPWALILLPLLFLFYVNYKALSSKDKPESFNKAVAWLKEDDFGQFYRHALGWLLDKISDWIGDKTQYKPHFTYQQGYQLSAFSRFFSVNPFTHQSFERVLRIAFIYPIVFFLMAWAMGSDTSVAGYVWFDNSLSNMPVQLRWQWLLLYFFLPFTGFYWLLKRAKKTQLLVLTLASVVAVLFVAVVAEAPFWIFLCFYGPSWLIAWLIKRNKGIADQLIFTFTFTFVFAFVVMVIVSNDTAVAAGAAVVAAAVIVAIATATATATTPVAVAAVAAVVAVAAVDDLAIDTALPAAYMLIILKRLLSYNEKKRYVGLFWFIYCGTLVFGAYYLINFVNEKLSFRLFLLFYFIYPLLNAPLDWLSLNITRGLLHSIRDRHHSGWQAFAWALFDLLLALFFLLMVSAVLVVGMAVADNITGQIMLQTLLVEIKQPETAINYIWVYPMLLTTLVPTLIHFTLAGASLIMWLPQSWRHRIADNVDKNYYKLWAATVYLSITPVIGLAAPIALLYGLYYLLMAQGGWLQIVLLQWAELLAHLFK